MPSLKSLERRADSGGHVKCWERLARTAAADDWADQLDLTVFFAGAETEEKLADHVRLRCLPPVFNSRKLFSAAYAGSC